MYQEQNRLLPKVWVMLFFASYFILGLWIIGDYGVSADEMTQRGIGQTSLSYLANVFHIRFLLEGQAPLPNPESVFLALRDRDYGVAFELPAELLIRIFNISDSESYLFRHYLTFTIFFIAICFFYRIARNRFGSWLWGLVGATLLILSPRFFGDGFFNNKDIIFAAFYLIATYTLVQFVARPTIGRAVWHALVCALAIDTRIVGIVLPAITIATMVFYGWSWRQLNGRRMAVLVFYLVALVIFVIGFWPWLWINPVEHFITALKNMAHFRHGADMVFLGDIISARNLPWYYIPLWIGITTPIFILVIIVVGLAAIMNKALRSRPWQELNWSLMQDLLWVMLSLGPLLAVIVLHSVLYNGWRQMYFIYAPLLLVGLRGLQVLWIFSASRRYWRYGLVIALIVGLGHTGYWMVRNHPYQYLYFNLMAGKFAQRFDVDYGGTAYHKLLERILQQDTTKTYSVFPQYHLWQINYFVGSQNLKPDQYRRLINNRSEACSDYMITILRGNRQQYSQKPEFELFDELVIDGQSVYTTYKRRVELYEYYAPALGKVIDFNNPDTRCFLLSGWADNNENWGVWSLGARATLRLFMPQARAKELRLDLRAFVNEKAPSQIVQIKVNGLEMKSQVLTHFQKNTVVLAIPENAYGKEWIEIEFGLPNARSPKSLGLGDDSRLLGIGLKSARFE